MPAPHAVRRIGLFAVCALLALGGGSPATAGAEPAGSAPAATTPAAAGAESARKRASRSTGRRADRSRSATAVRRRSVAQRRAAARRRAAAKRRRDALASDRLEARDESEASDAGSDADPEAVESPLAPPADLSAACADADVPLSPQSVAGARAAASCLVNQERARQGLGALVRNPALEAAGQAHAQDMVDRDFFAHDSPSGTSVLDRIRTSGYLTGAASFTVGENLGLAAGGDATPRTIVNGWMASPAHRANVLNREYREAGMGIVPAVPPTAGGGLPGGATLAQEFGYRST